MIAYERFESTWENFGKIHSPIPTWNQDTYQETWKDHIDKMSLYYLIKHASIYTYIYIYIYIYSV